MNKFQADAKQYSQHASNVLSWLQSINRTSKHATREPLQEQLQSLSCSYKNAQQKLLSLEKQLYLQSLHNQKQRSIIQILKYIVSGGLDDNTIINYLVQLQDQSKQTDLKYDISSQLTQIKQLIHKKQSQLKRSQYSKICALAELKKQVIKCNKIKRELMQDLDKALNDKGQLQSVIQANKLELKNQQQIITNLQAQLIELRNHSFSDKQLLKNNKIQLTNKQQIIGQYIQFQNQLKKCFLNLFSQRLQEKADILSYIKKIRTKIQKYKKLNKQKINQGLKQIQTKELLQSLKSFLNDDALHICNQFEKTGEKYLLVQLQGISKLQKTKYEKLQLCQQQVWRLKQKIMREHSHGKQRRTTQTNSIFYANSQVNIKNEQKISQFQTINVNQIQI